MTTDAYTALAGTTPAEKLAPLGILAEATIDLRTLAAAAADYGIAGYLFFEEDLARNMPLELVISRYREVPDDMRPYVRVENFLRFVQENDPSFALVMQQHPVMIRIVRVDQIAADPAVPPLVYVTGLMPYLDELNL
jgi:hypothetical protein